MTIAGIDPGQKGGVAIIGPGGEILTVCLMPLDAGRLPHARSLLRLLQWYAVSVVALELVGAMPKQGVVSMFSFGRHFGRLEAVLQLSGAAHVLVRPQEWQKEMLLGTPVGDPSKARAALAVDRLFPDVDVPRTPRSGRLHDGCVDALLIAEWARRHRRGIPSVAA